MFPLLLGLYWVWMFVRTVVWKTLWHNVSQASRQHGGSRPLVQGRSQTTAVNLTTLLPVLRSVERCTILDNVVPSQHV